MSNPDKKTPDHMKRTGVTETPAKDNWPIRLLKWLSKTQTPSGSSRASCPT